MAAHIWHGAFCLNTVLLHFVWLIWFCLLADWSRWARDAKFGRPVHQIWASPPNMPPWPLASPALMKWVSLIFKARSDKNQPLFNPFHFMFWKQRSAVSSRSRPGPCSPQRPAVTGPWRTRGPCGAAWGPTRCRLLAAPVRGPQAWGRLWATRTRSVAAARGRRATCCCWVVPLCSRLLPSDKTCCSWGNYRWENRRFWTSVLGRICTKSRSIDKRVSHRLRIYVWWWWQVVWWTTLMTDWSNTDLWISRFLTLKIK